MTLKLSQQPALMLFAIGLTLVNLALVAFSLYKVNNLSNSIDDLSQKSGIKYLLSESESTRQINGHINARIDAYVEQRKQEKVTLKYDDYQFAVERSLTNKHIYGEEDARFTLVEYSDLECPYCKRYHATPKKVVDSSSGLVNWQWKHLPLPFHNPVATIQAQASECVTDIAGNRAFWVFIHEVFEETKGNGQGAGDLVSIAKNIGVNGDAFSQCLNAGTFREKVAADLQKAKELGVNSTPVTFVVDNHTGNNVMLRGAQPPEAIVSTIQRMKKKADNSNNGNQSGDRP